MTWIDLGNPFPREEWEQYDLFQWETGQVQRLPVGSLGASPALFDVLQQRRTSRQFGPLGDAELADFFWHACRSLETWPSDLGFELEHRSAPSAGAIHPIHLVINRPGDARWWLYEPRGHLLIELPSASGLLSGLLAHSREVLDAPEATELLFLAEPGKTMSKYADGCSLIWRDTGALLGVMALAAQGLGLSFCPLGITGEPWASSLAKQRQLVGVGLALLGSASPTASR
ncbi:nitroreductase family protein (plasmid) [Pseudomonas sp. BYT-1]|uniref:nitroreductase family protein n=1 Tax=Pseudomonas sp. BYT-1 TaxID=2816906 RepID=UPI00218B8D18|nr:nitroreductase family protein [Pseudomonas sp. BYT-1]